MKSTIVVFILLHISCNQVAQSDDSKKAEGAQADQTLSQLAKRLKKQGWQEVSIPPLPAPCEGVVVKNELLEGIKQNQKATFTYHWVVIQTVRVPPNTEQKVILGFEAGDEKEGNIELADPNGSTIGETVVKKKWRPSGSPANGFSTKAKTAANQEKIYLGLQQAIDISDSEGKLICRAYLKSIGSASLKRMKPPKREE